MQQQQGPHWAAINNQAPRYNNSILVVVGRYIISVGGHPQHIHIFDTTNRNTHRVAFIPGSEALNFTQFSACAYHENRIVIFGGRDNHNNILDDVFVISLQENEQGIFANCKRQTTTNNGCRRYGHTTHIFGNTMYVIGGIAGHGDNANRVWSLKLHPYYQWESHIVAPNNLLHMPVWVHGHKSVLKGGKIYVLNKNEEDGLQYVHQQIYMLDLEATGNRAWTKVNVPALDYQIEPLNFDEMLEIEGRLYFFERDPPTQETYSEVIHSYDIANRRWVGRARLPTIGTLRFSLTTYGNRFILWGFNQTIYALSPNDLLLNVHPTEAEYNEQINDITAQNNALIAQTAAIDRESPARNKRINELEAESHRLTQELDAKNIIKERAQQKVVDLQQTLNEDKLRNRNQNVHTAKVVLTSIESAQLEKLERERAELKGNLRANLSMIEKLKQEAKTLQKGLETTRERVEHSQTEMTSLINAIPQENERLASLQEDVGNLQIEIRKQERTTNDLKQEKIKVEKKVTNKREENDQLKECNRNLKRYRTYLSFALGLVGVLFISALP